MRHLHSTLIGIVDMVHILAPIGRFHRRRVSVLQEQVSNLLKRNVKLQDKVRSQADDIARLNGYVARLEEDLSACEEEIATFEREAREADAAADAPIPYKPAEGSPELTLAESPAYCDTDSAFFVRTVSSPRAKPPEGLYGGFAREVDPCGAEPCGDRACEERRGLAPRCKETDIHYPWRYCGRELPCPYHLPTNATAGARNVDANGSPVEDAKKSPMPSWLPLATMMLLPLMTGLIAAKPARATGATDAEFPSR